MVSTAQRGAAGLPRRAEGREEGSAAQRPAGGWAGAGAGWAGVFPARASSPRVTAAPPPLWPLKKPGAGSAEPSRAGPASSPLRAAPGAEVPRCGGAAETCAGGRERLPGCGGEAAPPRLRQGSRASRRSRPEGPGAGARGPGRASHACRENKPLAEGMPATEPLSRGGSL